MTHVRHSNAVQLLRVPARNLCAPRARGNWAFSRLLWLPKTSSPKSSMGSSDIIGYHRISSDIIGYHRISDQGTDPKELSTTLRGLGMSGGCVGGFMRILSYGILRQTLETFYTHYSYIQSLITSNHIWVHWFQYDNPKESEDSKKIQSDSDCKWL